MESPVPSRMVRGLSRLHHPSHCILLRFILFVVGLLDASSPLVASCCVAFPELLQSSKVA